MLSALVALSLVPNAYSWDLILESHQGMIVFSRKGHWTVLHEPDQGTSLQLTPLGPAVSLGTGLRFFNKRGHVDARDPYTLRVKNGRFQVWSGNKRLYDRPATWMPTEVRFWFNQGEPPSDPDADDQVMGNGTMVLWTSRGRETTTIRFWNQGKLRFSKDYSNNLNPTARLCRNGFSIAWSFWDDNRALHWPVRSSASLFSPNGNLITTLRRPSTLHKGLDEWIEVIDFDGDRCLMARMQSHMGSQLRETSFRNPRKWDSVTDYQFREVCPLF